MNTAVAVVSACALALVSPTLAAAGFQRPLLRQITGTPSGTFAEGGREVGGAAVDGEGHLWVGDIFPREGEVRPNALDEYSAAAVGNEFIASLQIDAFTLPQSLAIEPVTGTSLVTGAENQEGFRPFVEAFTSTGELSRQWEKFGKRAYVAVDDNTDSLQDPAACTFFCAVYVAHEEENAAIENGGNEKPAGVERFNGDDEPVAFAASAPYIHGNEIVGAPEGASGCEVGVPLIPLGVTVDSGGNFYVLDKECRTLTPAVLEYASSGEFVRAITGAETPGVRFGATEFSHEFGGWGGPFTAISFDPASNHVLVGIRGHLLDQERGQGAIDEIDASSGRFVDQIAETTANTPLPAPTAIAADSVGDVYAAALGAGAVDVFGPARLEPGLRLAAVSEAAPSHAVLHGAIDAEGLTLTSCGFQYVSEEAFEQTGFSDLSSGGEVPCSPAAGEIVADHAFHPVSAGIGGLVSGTIYRYRLVGATEQPPGGPGASEILAFTAPAPPRIDSVSSTDVSASFATLRATIDPRGAATTYRFEYVDDASFNASGYTHASVTASASLGAGGADGSLEASVAQPISGLAPGTGYHFRAQASNLAGEASPIEGTLATLPVAGQGLPDGRAYELVTPANKGGAADMFARASSQREFVDNEEGLPSQAGDAFELKTVAGFGSFPGSGESVYVFRHDPGHSGWTTTSLAAPPPGSPALGVQRIEWALLEPEHFLRTAFVDELGSEAGFEGGARRMSLVGAIGGPYTTIQADAPRRLEGSGAGEATIVAGISRSVNHVILDSKDHGLAPGAAAEDEGAGAVYDWTGGGGCGEVGSSCNLVNVDSAGALLSRCGALLGYEREETQWGATHNAVSADGSTIFFTAPDPTVPLNVSEPQATEGCWNRETNENTPQVYARHGTTTIEVSKPAAGVEEEVEPGVERAPVLFPTAYVGASEDGRKVFFVTHSVLTTDDENNHDLELYEYDTGTGALTRISSGEDHRSPGGVVEVKAISADGSAVYFTSTAKLTSSAPEPPAEKLNVYRYGLDAARTANGTAFVASIPADERPLGGSAGWFGEHVMPTPSTESWYSTPNGRYLAFATTAPLSGFDFGPGECESLGQACKEVFRYDADAPVSHGDPSVPDNPACVSCPSTPPPLSSALFSRSPSRTLATGPVRAMSNDGSYVFFDTADALVTQDTNETLDVYEWHDGHASLITSGKDPAPSFFLGASSDGSDVFFGTHARLIPQDTDGSGDVYDARICTSDDPCPKAGPAGAAPCEGGGCQGDLASAPAALPPTLSGQSSGNVPEQPLRPTSKPTAKQKLSKALLSCHRLSKRRRRRCEAQARSRYRAETRPNRARRASTNRRAGR